MSLGIEQAAASIERQLGEPPRLRFPDNWTFTSSWERAQREPDTGGPVSPAERVVLLGEGKPHRVLFAIYDGALRAECDCESYRYRGWCAHVASCWWRWVRSDLSVVDLDTGETHVSPPWWLSVGGDR